ncbi:MAG: DUF5820 family protein [Halobacteriaceae archaeon]
MEDADLPQGWRVWNEEPAGRAVLVYRPDVFEGESFPAECLPTLYVSCRPPERRRRTDAPTGEWHVAFYLEPEVRVRSADATAADRDGAVAAAVETARAFARGDIDPREAYQVPREAYLEKLVALTGAGREA